MNTGTTEPSASTVERAIALLDCLARADTSMGVRELARQLGISPAAVHRLLATFKASNIVQQDPATRGYALGWGVLRYADVVLRRTHIIDGGASVARRLRDLSQETVTIYVPDGSDRICVYEVESAQDVRRHVGLGTRVPLAAGCSGRAILAFLTPTEIDAVLAVPIPRFTASTISDPARLRVLLAETRTTGISMSSEETVAGAASIAAPVFEIGGRVAGSIAISGPSSRFTSDRARQLAPALLEASEHLSSALGFSGPPPWLSTRNSGDQLKPS
jgi:DNA-binding IclR family transcriptional regulator